MVIISPPGIQQQDTLKPKVRAVQDTVTALPDSLHISDSLQIKKSDSLLVIKSDSLPVIKKDTVKKISRPVRHIQEVHITDTTSVCTRNSVYDFTFSDSTNLVIQPGFNPVSSFPVKYVEKIRKEQAEERTSLVAHLQPGEKLPAHAFHDDWIILVIMGAAFLYSIIRSSSSGLLNSILKFFLFRGISEASSRDLGGLFTWQSTMLNFVSFTVLGLFAYMASEFYNIALPVSIKLLGWLLCTGIIIAGVTARHFMCILTGNISGKRDIFREYLVSVYESYRVAALIIFFIVILISYTTFLPSSVFFFTGLTVLGLIYILRFARLLIIFLNRNISIFYLILYLCALEILPVLVLVKYFTGLI
ncbi:MAG TPA: DUF4271 domain-containing protein [Bacteroidales bacterium]|nr:DUF4271 domain-containing protein [Bacteroidales bacterium]